MLIMAMFVNGTVKSVIKNALESQSGAFEMGC